MEALAWLDKIEEERSRTAHMFGRESFIDGDCVIDYDPFLHAESLGLPIVHRRRLPTPQMVACYSRKHNAVFVRPDLHSAVERCAVAHEIVHFEHNDVGTTKSQEDRADRIAAQRLVRPSRVEEIAATTEDPARIALELDVTEKIMRAYLRQRRNGYV